MKRQFDLHLEEHISLLQKAAFKSLSGIKVNEMIDIRKKFSQDINEYIELIQFLYHSQLSFLNLFYELNDEVERTLFGYMDYIIREISLDDLHSSTTLSFSENS